MCLLVTSFDGPCKVSTKSNDKVPKVAVDLEQVSTAVWTGFRHMASKQHQTCFTQNPDQLHVALSYLGIDNLDLPRKFS